MKLLLDIKLQGYLLNIKIVNLKNTLHSMTIFHLPILLEFPLISVGFSDLSFVQEKKQYIKKYNLFLFLKSISLYLHPLMR